MKVVLDASAAISAVLRHDHSSKVQDVLSDASVVLAPDLFVAEVTGALLKYAGARLLPLEQASRHLAEVVMLVDDYQPVAALAQEVLREAAARSRSVYDLFYLVLARREGASIVTLDRRLRRAAASAGVRVHPSLR